MNCTKALRTMYEAYGETLSFRERCSLAFHVLFCRACARELNRLEQVRDLLAGDFFPEAPDFEDAVMADIYAEEANAFSEIPAGFPVRAWVIAGVIAVVSLATTFFGGDFTGLAASQGSSYLLPLGIMTGLFVSVYGSLFVGSHLKEFSQRFHLR